MIKKMFVKNGYNFDLIDLVIDDNDLAFWNSLMEYYPIWDKIKKENEIGCRIEEYALKFGFDVKKDAWIVTRLINKLLYEENPLVISDTMKKLYEYIPSNETEKRILENLFARFSYKLPDVKMKDNCSIMNEVAGLNYCSDSVLFNATVEEMIENEKECTNLSKKKEKKLVNNIKNSIPRKNVLF